MEYLSGGLTLELCSGAFPLSTDSVALSEFVKLPKNAKVLDLGSGCGTLGLLLCGRNESCAVTGVEISRQAHETAMQNQARNHLEGRFMSICADLTAIPEFLTPGSFQVAVSNPPYFTAGPRSKSVPLARREDACTLDDLFRSAAWATAYGGDFFLVHRPERLAQICSLGVKYKLEPKRLRLIRHREGGPVSLILVQCRKGGKPGLCWEEECLYDPQNQPTGYYRKLYHL